MSTTTVYFVDEDPAQRDNTGWALRKLFEGNEIKIESIAPLQEFAAYGALLHGQVAFLVDEKLSVTGEVQYDGHQLATYLRGVRPDIPIFIITAFPPETVPVEAQVNIEGIIGKTETTPGDPSAERFRARFLRALGAYEAALTDGARRVHELILKSVSETLTEAEANELHKLDQGRQAPAESLEASQATDLKKEIEQLKNVLAQLEKGEE